MICEEIRRKKEKKRRRRCGDVVDEAQLLAATIETLSSGTFKKEKFDDRLLLTFKLSLGM